LESKTFADLGLSPKVQAAITAAGYVNPTPIQAAAIPVAVTGRDVLGIAQTGTGKTAGFVLPMITRLESGRARARMPRSLILAPTRELAAQVAQSFEKYGVNHKLAVALLIGGVSMDDQVKKLDRGVDVLIATPGRLLDHFGRGRIMSAARGHRLGYRRRPAAEPVVEQPVMRKHRLESLGPGDRHAVFPSRSRTIAELILLTNMFD